VEHAKRSHRFGAMNRRMSDLCNEPLRVVVTEGAVVILGPYSTAISLTPEAAVQSARALDAAAAEATAICADNNPG
jgi:hypothetical protein